MPIEVVWGDEQKKILQQNYLDRWEWIEFFEANKQTVAMMQEVSHRVDVIADMQNGVMPTTGASFANAKNAMRNLPTNWGIMVIVTNRIVGKLVDVFKQFDQEFSKKVYTASNIEQAHTVIDKHRTNISDK